jgi:energy-coupling factor transporter ATP-binding protein EcfA2
MKELIYLYIGNIGRDIKECGIEFSNRYKVFYNNVDYGKNINNLKLLVGRNGCGKSTILDLLGTIRDDREIEFPVLVTKNCSWFALYHLYDNIFVIEGYNPNMILEVQDKCEIYLKKEYSAVIKYDMKKKSILEVYPLQEYHIKGLTLGV